MKQLLINIYRRIDRFQRVRWVRIILSVLAVGLVGSVFVPIITVAADLESQRGPLIAVLQEANIHDEDEAAVQLRETGTVYVGDREYGGAQFRDANAVIFGQDGYIVGATELAERMLAPQKPDLVPRFLQDNPATSWQLAVILLLWLLLIIWMNLTLAFVLTCVATAAVAAVFSALDYQSGVLAVTGIGLLTFTFVLLTRAVLTIFSYRSQTLAVAHTVVKEAMRLRISLVFIVLLLLLLPLIPLQLDPSIPLRYQVQTFITRSMGITWVMAACMTLFLSCATVAFEIRDRQIWQLVTKPMNRFNYLLGKWLGVMSINLVLLIVSGVSTFLFIQYLRERPAANLLDARAVEEEVLVARATAQPDIKLLEPEQLRSRVNKAIEEDPVLKEQIDSGEINEITRKRHLARQIQQQYRQQQRSIPPGEYREYVFHGLGTAAKLHRDLRLRYQFHAGAEDSHKTHPVIFRLPMLDQFHAREFIPVQTHFLPLSYRAIDENGDLTLRIHNMDYEGDELTPGEWTTNFDPDGLEVLYEVSSFEANFARAISVVWIKLGFLSVLGVACATLLSFPVACLMSFTIFLAASITPYLTQSLSMYYVEEYYRIDQLIIHAIASFVTFAFGQFAAISPTSSLVEGKLIPLWEVIKTAVIIGVMWSGLMLFFAWLVFRRRELANYSGQG